MIWGAELIKNLNYITNTPFQKQKHSTCKHTPNTSPINITPKTLILQLIPISQHEMNFDDQLPDNEYM